MRILILFVKGVKCSLFFWFFEKCQNKKEKITFTVCKDSVCVLI